MKKYPLQSILENCKLLSITLFIVLPFYSSVKAQALQPIISGEYFFDADPGFGNATSLVVNSSTTVDLNTVSIPFANLTEGIHFLYVRFKDNQNRWSVPVRKPFYANPIQQQIVPITQAEYFINTDPGFGLASNITITNASTIDIESLAIPTTNLPEGIHYLYVRFKDNQNRWSVPVRKPFYVATNFNNPSPIVAAEFFIDEDPGFENAANIPITAGILVNTTVDLSYQNLSEGTHFLYVRVKNEEGKWSLAAKREFIVTALSSDAFQWKKSVVYPNPFTDVLNIDLDDFFTILSIELFDSLGKKVTVPNWNNNQIQLAGLPIGIYILRISTIDNQQISFKISKI